MSAMRVAYVVNVGQASVITFSKSEADQLAGNTCEVEVRYIPYPFFVDCGDVLDTMYNRIARGEV